MRSKVIDWGVTPFYFYPFQHHEKILKVISIILLTLLAGYWYFEYPHTDKITIGYEGGESTVLTPGSEGYRETKGEILNITKSINCRVKGVEEDWNMPERKKHADHIELEFSRPTDITTKIGTLEDVRAIYIERGSSVVFVDYTWAWVWNMYRSGSEWQEPE